MKKLCVAGVACAIVTMSAVTAFAGDGSRKGFAVGGGLGLGYQNANVTLTGVPKDGDDHYFAFGTDIRIGYGVSEETIVYFDNKNSWFSFDGGSSIDKDMASFGIAGIGASYYFDPGPGQTSYVLGSIGLAYWLWPGDGGVEATGVGFSVGFGAEFAPHWSVEATVGWGNPSEGEFDSKGTQVLVTLVGLYY